mmetsp:Transcript_280/g.808  ORF Transcript_280/g.808 Transcript_280/m.808 type:complete len:241 (+) Transcript_280:435-1157(+)
MITWPAPPPRQCPPARRAGRAALCLWPRRHRAWCCRCLAVQPLRHQHPRGLRPPSSVLRTRTDSSGPSSSRHRHRRRSSSSSAAPRAAAGPAPGARRRRGSAGSRRARCCARSARSSGHASKRKLRLPQSCDGLLPRLAPRWSTTGGRRGRRRRCVQICVCARSCSWQSSGRSGLSIPSMPLSPALAPGTMRAPRRQRKRPMLTPSQARVPRSCSRTVTRTPPRPPRTGGAWPTAPRCPR